MKIFRFDFHECCMLNLYIGEAKNETQKAKLEAQASIFAYQEKIDFLNHRLVINHPGVYYLWIIIENQEDLEQKISKFCEVIWHSYPDHRKIEFKKRFPLIQMTNSLIKHIKAAFASEIVYVWDVNEEEVSLQNSYK